MDDQSSARACDERRWDEETGGEVCTIGDVLAELLARYQDRYPEIRITLVETSSAAA